MKYERIMLVIIDGFGYRKEKKYNAILNANTPYFDYIKKKYPFTTIGASGKDVGLPEGQMGNSEVGHLNLGAGRIVYQEVTRISNSIGKGEFFHNKVLIDAIEAAKQNNKAVHLIGLVSDGGVHSSWDHIEALIKMAKKLDQDELFIHVITDGRDTSPKSGIKFIENIQNYIREISVGKIATVAGRYYSMDRDNRWDRTKKAYDAYVLGEGKKFNSPKEAVKDSYENKITDEFIIPSVITENGNPVATLENGDSVIFFNFRADRVRQICTALGDDDFDKFDRKKVSVKITTMTQYKEDFNFPVAFKPVKLDRILGEIIAENGYKQLRIAETEKYAHVTYFFNGGDEKSFKNEDRILIPSPKVTTYDLKPEMSAYEVADKVTKLINEDKYELIVLNYANLDMVGHTGDFDAAVKAVETVDACSKKVIDKFVEKGGIVILTADHGNAELMWDENLKSPYTAHTTNRVPLWIINENYGFRLREGGRLADIAPTILHLLNIKKPENMTGKSLIESKK